jgi:hypothetical protein
MNDPRRLLDGDGDALEQALLRSAKQDEPESGKEHAVLFALGLAPPGLGIPSGLGSSSAASASAAGAAATAAAKLGTWSIVKWIGVGVIAGTATLGGAKALHGSFDVPKSAPSIIIPSAPASIDLVNTQPPSAQDAGAQIEPDAQAAPRVIASEKPSASAPADLSLAAEVAALDRARKALESNDPEAALRAIEERGRSHPDGVLQPEAMVVRIEALTKMGQRQAALELGRQFMTKYPDHPLRERVRALMSEPDAGRTKEGAKP